MNNELDPVGAAEVARLCFAATSPKVTSDKVKAGLFPECDFSIPHGRWPKSLWFRATVDAWRKKYFARTVVTRERLRELQAADDEQAVRDLHVENMKIATAHAKSVGDSLIEEHRDGDRETSAA